jgi:hypothetical protein
MEVATTFTNNKNNNNTAIPKHAELLSPLTASKSVKRSEMVSHGLQRNETPETIADIWRSWSFQSNFGIWSQ